MGVSRPERIDRVHSGPLMQPLGSKRRTSAEVQRLVLNAAVEVFAQEGFGGASTRRIAESAGVNETVIFRYFLSKAGLYEAAVLSPIRVVAAALCEPPATDRVERCACNRVEAWVRQVDAVTRQHLALLVALFNPGPPTWKGVALEGRVRSVREELFSELDRGARTAVGGAPHDVVRLIAVRTILTMLMAMRSDDSSRSRTTTRKPATPEQYDRIVSSRRLHVARRCAPRDGPVRGASCCCVGAAIAAPFKWSNSFSWGGSR